LHLDLGSPNRSATSVTDTPVWTSNTADNADLSPVSSTSTRRSVTQVALLGELAGIRADEPTETDETTVRPVPRRPLIQGN
jgi:hypothetical protein